MLDGKIIVDQALKKNEKANLEELQKVQQEQEKENAKRKRES
jgi:hypothetical protein